MALYENLRLFILRLVACLPSASHPTPICSTVNIIDLEGVSLSLIWSIRAHLQASTALASTCYPEFISRIFVVNAPFFFPRVWDLVKVSLGMQHAHIAQATHHRGSSTRGRGTNCSFLGRTQDLIC